MSRVKELRIKYGYTQDMLGNMLGVQKAAICKYETGRSCLPQDMLIKLSDIFSVSVDYLLDRTDIPDRDEDAVSFFHVPILGSVHAGLPILAEENIDDYVPIPTSDVRGGNYFFMEVEGDCMIDAHITEGSLVLVHMQPRVENGQIAVVRIEDEVVLRRVKWLDNQLVLYPANSNYEPMIIKSGDAQIVGRVVECRIRGF